MTIAITGSSGFLGSYLCQYFRSLGLEICPLSQNSTDIRTTLPSLACLNSDFKHCLSGVSAIVHCAALAHRPNSLRDTSASQLFNTVNHLSAVKLAKDGLACGIKRFVFISSIKVHGDFSNSNEQFVPSSPYSPLDIYAQSKVDAEISLINLAKNSDLELVIVRPPLIHGPFPKGNIKFLLRLIKAGVPLPIASSLAKRSFVHVENLAATINYFLSFNYHSPAVVIPSDCNPVTVIEFVNYLASTIDSRALLCPFSPSLMKYLCILIQRRSLYTSLFDNFQANHFFFKKQVPIHLPFVFPPSAY